MISMKYMLITFAIPLFFNVLVNADIASVDSVELTPKLSIFGHTGQDPAPHRSIVWSGDTSVINERITNTLKPLIDDVFTFNPLDKTILIDVYNDLPMELDDYLSVSIGGTDVTPTVDLPFNGGIPSPPTIFLLALGLYRKRRTSE